ncbi:MAG: hypothetical protein V2A67_04910 [Bacteroidota bacterium]
MLNIPDIWKERLVPGSEKLVEQWLDGAQIRLKLSRSRATKHGDFRFPRNGLPAMITLNRDMHPVEFMITLSHELAHYRAWKKYGRSIRPHGEQWKHEFRWMLKELIESGVLKSEVSRAVYQCYFKRERIGSSAAEPILRVLGKTGEYSGFKRVADVPEGTAFRLKNGKVLVKGKKLRSRFRCRDPKSGRDYSVSPMAEIAETLVI